MDDSCAVCAETLEWVAYGPCGHREVCSTCVIRLRFVCHDLRCCICKSESSFIFVTKALGDFTRMILDFSSFPTGPIEGRVGSYWYHEGTQTFFDDLDHYKMIKAMCKLSCIVCDKLNERRSSRFVIKSIDQLKNHLFNKHRLVMCTLCLEGRKIFICEQKLYTKQQLSQHIRTGDSEIDGTESERGGFMGHPLCEFCQDPFYGDNELYMHMSTEHYTCHICQRQHPGQFEYYKNYDDMENHFRQEHFLCEDEACLAKKFVVFANESEIKKHTAIEHGGNLSRSKRNAVLQIPTSFRFRRIERDRHGRGRGSHLGLSDNQLSLAIQASVETANAERFHDNSSSSQPVSGPQQTSAVNTIINPFEVLSTSNSEPSPIHPQAVGQSSSNAPLEGSSFPPLPVASRGGQQNSVGGSGWKKMAARIRRQNSVKVLNVPRARPAAAAASYQPNSTTARPAAAASYQPNSTASGSYYLKPVSDSGSLSLSGSSSSSQSKPGVVNEHVPSSSSARSAMAIPARTNGLAPANFASSSTVLSGMSKASHSASAPNLLEKASLDNSISNFPPVSSATQANKVSSSSQNMSKGENVQSANKALVEKVRAALGSDENTFAAFKIISADFRKDLITTEEYLAYVHQFGLSHLVLELAKLCPDDNKRRELIEMYNFNSRSGGSNENSLRNDVQVKQKKGSKKGKEKLEDNRTSFLKIASAGNVSSVQSSREPSVEEFKNGFHSAKGKSKILVDEQSNSNSTNWPQMESRSTESSSQSTGGGGGLKKDMVTVGGGNKPRKKMPKFLKNRLGDAALAAAELGNGDSGSSQSEEKKCGNTKPPEGLPVRGVWQSGGGRKLVAMTQTYRAK